MRRLTAVMVGSMMILTACNEASQTQQESVHETSAAAVTTAAETSVTEAAILTKTAEDNIDTAKVNKGRIKQLEAYRDGMKICGEIFLPDSNGPFPTVVISGGLYATGDAYSYHARQFAENGFAAVIFDFIGTRGGRGDGNISELSYASETADLSAVLDQLGSFPEIDKDRLFLWGHSFGGLVSTYIGCCRSDEIKGMILLEPSYRSLTLPPEVDYDDKRDDVYSMMPKFRGDVLILLGTEDHALGSDFPGWFDEAKASFASCEVRSVKGADHCFTNEFCKEALKQSCEFMNERGRGSD